jgi:hypothetical protein
MIKIDKDSLHDLYVKWVDQVSENNDLTIRFESKEIVYAIVKILEKNPSLYQSTKKEQIDRDIRWDL